MKGDEFRTESPDRRFDKAEILDEWERCASALRF
jgi:hypothetical protein